MPCSTPRVAPSHSSTPTPLTPPPCTSFLRQTEGEPPASTALTTPPPLWPVEPVPSATEYSSLTSAQVSVVPSQGGSGLSQGGSGEETKVSVVPSQGESGEETKVSVVPSQGGSGLSQGGSRLSQGGSGEETKVSVDVACQCHKQATSHPVGPEVKSVCLSGLVECLLSLLPLQVLTAAL